MPRRGRVPAVASRGSAGRGFQGTAESRRAGGDVSAHEDHHLRAASLVPHRIAFAFENARGTLRRDRSQLRPLARAGPDHVTQVIARALAIVRMYEGQPIAAFGHRLRRKMIEVRGARVPEATLRV